METDGNQVIRKNKLENKEEVRSKGKLIYSKYCKKIKKKKSLIVVSIYFLSCLYLAIVPVTPVLNNIIVLRRGKGRSKKPKR